MLSNWYFEKSPRKTIELTYMGSKVVWEPLLSAETTTGNLFRAENGNVKIFPRRDHEQNSNSWTAYGKRWTEIKTKQKRKRSRKFEDKQKKNIMNINWNFFSFFRNFYYYHILLENDKFLFILMPILAFPIHTFFTFTIFENSLKFKID